MNPREQGTAAGRFRLAGLSADERARLEERLKGRRVPARAEIPLRPDRTRSQLSFAQQRLWLLDRLYPGTSAYNVTRLVGLPGPVDAAALGRALDRLVARHEVLRTTIHAGDGEPVGHLLEHATVDLSVVDLAQTEAAEREAATHDAAVDLAQQSFDLSKDVLLRARLIRLAPDEHQLVLVTHHIASDEGSRTLLVENLGALYRAELDGESDPLPPLPLQYGDFAAWQRERLAGPLLEEQLEYWRGRLTDLPSGLELPADHPRPAVATLNGARASRAYPGELVERLRHVGQREGATLFMTMLAGFYALLHRYSGQRDLVVGTPISGRDRAELNGLIGLFLNNLVLRVDVDPDRSFRELIQCVKAAAIEAYAHQDVPFERLVEEMRPERDLGRSPLFQVVFTMEATDAEADFGDVRVRVSGVDAGSTKYDLTLVLRERHDGLRGVVEYSTDLFERDRMIDLLEHLERLLSAAAADPDVPVGRLPLLSEEEERELVYDRNPLETEYPREATVPELVGARVPARSKEVAVEDERVRLTYEELESRGNRFARHLRSLGVVPGVLVGICVERSAAMVCALLGIMKSGAAYVPIDPNYPADRQAFMLRDAGIKVLVCEQGLADTLPEHDAQTVLLDGGWGEISEHEDGPLDLPPDPERLAYVIHTSGSTGQPKGVQIPQRALVNFLWSMLDRPGLGPDDVLVAVTTLSFDIAGLELYLPLVAGGRLVVAGREASTDPRALGTLLEESGATVMQATPATWRMLVESGWPGAAGLKALCGGEALPAALAEALLERGVELWNMYGPTETTIWSAVDRVEDGALPAIGRPIANTTFYVLDSYLQAVPDGVPGELHIGGDGVAAGYLDRPELTAARFIADPFTPGKRLYKTGDLVRYLPDGRLEFLGRLDHQVKIRGFRVELGEIEAVLTRHPAVRTAVAVVRESSPGDARIIAYVVPAADAVSATELRQHVADLLPPYMIPSAVVSLDTLPLTPNGKVDRKALPAPNYEREESHRYVAPRTPLEETLVNIWEEVLEVRPIGIADDFFELGGHSLLAAQVVARIWSRLGVELPLMAFFERPQIESLALTLSERLLGAVDTSDLESLLAEVEAAAESSA